MNAAVDETTSAPDSLYREVTESLFREATLLDEGRFKQWLTLLTEDVRYRLVAPNLSAASPAAGPSSETVLMDETFGSFQTRVQQLTTPAFTIAENPRPFTRRFVANILIDAILDDASVQVRSNLLVYRSRGSQMDPHVFSMARRDVWRQIGRTLRLARRDGRLDESVVGARNIVALW